MKQQIAALPGRSHRWRWLRNILALSVLSVALLAAYMWWVVARFDRVSLPANHGKVATELFVKATGTYPLIVGLGGAEGGNSWASGRWKKQRDRFLARGYAVLALGYFGLPNTPAQLDRIALEGVHDAILLAAKDPRVDGSCIALIGGSRGAELALLLASQYSDIGAVVALVPSSAVFPSLTDAMVTSAFSLNGKELPFVPMTWGATPALVVGDLRGAFEQMMRDTNAMQRAAIAVEKIQGPLLFVSATQDESWPSKEMSDAMLLRLQAHQFTHVAEHWPISGGHNEPLDEFP